MMLDELALRKEGFEEGTRVVLADGQEWSIPEYTFIFMPEYGEDGRITAGGRASFGADVDADLDVWLGSVDVQPIERLSAMMRVACELLTKNYNLDISALQTLLKKDGGDPANREMWAELTRAVQGLSPKA